MKIIKSENEAIEIVSIIDWKKYFHYATEGKKKKFHSAEEMAKFWTNPNEQRQFIEFIQNAIPDCDLYCAIPEFDAKFDKKGKSRKDDLRIFSIDEKTIISIEGKVDEPFGNSVFYDELIKSIINKKETPSSKKFDRLINLYLNFFSSNERIFDIRYQLLYWFAGAINAKNKNSEIENIIMIVQEFRINNDQSNSQKQNHKEFNKFITFISKDKYQKICENEIIKIGKNEYTNDKNLFLGYYIKHI